LANSLARGGAISLRLPSGDVEILREQFVDTIANKPKPAPTSAPKPRISRPRRPGTVIVTPGAEDESDLFSYTEGDDEPGYAPLPDEVGGFVGGWGVRDATEQRFYEWLLKPSQLNVAIWIDNRLTKINRNPPVSVVS
jgi:hypothetical protein